MHESSVIRIRRAAVRTKGAYTVTTPKSDAGVRDVDIPPHILPAIEDHLSRYVGADRDSLIFPADNGGHLQPSTLYRWWYKARTSAGRPDLRFHDLRHSGAVLAAVSGLCGAGASVCIGPRWSEPLVLWQALVGTPSSGKSPAMA